MLDSSMGVRATIIRSLVERSAVNSAGAPGNRGGRKQGSTAEGLADGELRNGAVKFGHDDDRRCRRRSRLSWPGFTRDCLPSGRHWTERRGPSGTNLTLPSRNETRGREIPRALLAGNRAIGTQLTAFAVGRSGSYCQNKQSQGGELPMGRFRGVTAVAGICAAFVAVTGEARANDGFYKGKRLTVLVNYAPGGSTDTEARVFVRHIGRVLEGQPAVIIQNMEGAGGFVGAKYVGEVASRDGTLAGYLTATAFLAALEPERFKVDFR